MLRYSLKRLSYVFPSLIGVITLSFLLIHFVPGDPVDLMLGEQASLEDRQNLRHELGLDQPILKQYGNYLAQLAQFDFGRSLVSRETVGRELLSYFPATLHLSTVALLLALIWGLPLGVQAAVKPQSAWGWLSESIGLIGMSIPAVFLGPVLVYVLAIKIDLFPVSERDSWDSVILPAVSLAVPLGAVIARMTRTSVREVLNEDFIRTARAKGAPDVDIYFKHALRNALIPIVTVVCMQLSALLTGTVITETIFDWPGVGTLLFTAIQQRDYPVVQACILIIACIYVFVNLMGDLLYGVVNPRVRLDDE